MLKAVIFDMDGVIIDSEPHHYKAASILFDSLHIKPTDEEWQSYLGLSSNTMWSRIKELFQFPMTVAELIDLDRQNRQIYFNSLTELQPISGVPELLSDLKIHGVRAALASSSPIAFIEHIVSRMGLSSCFEYCVSGDFVSRGKPAPDIFLHTAELLGLLPEECVVIEDSTNGITAAKSAGMKCIGFANRNSKGQDLSRADCIIDSFYDLTVDMLYRE